MLTIMCITRVEPFAVPFLEAMSALASMLGAKFVLGIDGRDAMGRVRNINFSYGLPSGIIPVESSGILESVHDDVVAQCEDGYILRLDDDEECSPAMVEWLVNQLYLNAPHWKFPRAHLWMRRDLVLTHPQLWPDHQTRLSVKKMADGRNHIHAGSPYGGGAEAPVCLLHHKFLVKSVEERRAIAARYDRVWPGSGTGGMLAFNVPEDLGCELTVAKLGTGVAEDVHA